MRLCAIQARTKAQCKFNAKTVLYMNIQFHLAFLSLLRFDRDSRTGHCARLKKGNKVSIWHPPPCSIKSEPISNSRFIMIVLYIVVDLLHSPILSSSKGWSKGVSNKNSAEQNVRNFLVPPACFSVVVVSKSRSSNTFPSLPAQNAIFSSVAGSTKCRMILQNERNTSGGSQIYALIWMNVIHYVSAHEPLYKDTYLILLYNLTCTFVRGNVLAKFAMYVSLLT